MVYFVFQGGSAAIVRIKNKKETVWVLEDRGLSAVDSHDLVGGQEFEEAVDRFAHFAGGGCLDGDPDLVVNGRLVAWVGADLDFGEGGIDIAEGVGDRTLVGTQIEVGGGVLLTLEDLAKSTDLGVEEPRDPRQEIDVAADDQRHVAVGRVEQVAALGHVGHPEGAVGEAIAPPGPDHPLEFDVAFDPDAECSCHRRNGAIVVGRADATRGDDGVEAFRAESDLSGDLVLFVAHGDDAPEVDPEVAHEFDDALDVGVADFAGQDFVADDESSSCSHRIRIGRRADRGNTEKGRLEDFRSEEPAVEDHQNNIGHDADEKEREGDLIGPEFGAALQDRDEWDD